MRRLAYEQLGPYLLPGERLIWCGRPAKQNRITSRVIIPGFVLLFASIIWIIGIRAALVAGPAGWFVGAFVSFVCGSFWLTIITEATRSGRTAYGVTDRRVIIADSLFRYPVKCIDYHNLLEIKHFGSREFGAIHCARTSMAWKNQSKPGKTVYPALFRRIVGAGAVHDLILLQQARALRDDPPAVPFTS